MLIQRVCYECRPLPKMWYFSDMRRLQAKGRDLGGTDKKTGLPQFR